MGSIPLPALNIRPPENPLDQYAKAISVKSMIGGQQLQNQEIQAGQIKNQEAQQALADQRAMTKSMNEWDGKDVESLPSIILKNGGSANAVFGLKKQLLDQRQAVSKIALDDSIAGKNQVETLQKQHDMIAGGLGSIVDPKVVPDDKLHDEATRAVNGFLADGTMDAAHARDLQAKIEATKNPQELRTMIDHYAKVHMGASEIAANAKSDAETMLSKVKSSTEPWKEIPGTGTFYNVLTGESKTPSGAVLSPSMMEAKYVGIQQQQAMKNPISKEDQAFLKGYEKYKALVPQINLALQNGLLKDSAKDMAAEKYWQTGQMPTGMRSPAMSAAIQNRAAELHPDGAKDLAGNQAAYAANKKSLGSIQQNFDQVTAFENTAGRNLDLFLGTAKKISDTGSPWLNKPWRDVQSGLAGSSDLAAFNAARTTALTEIAKVLNSSNASGVLSDSARKEVDSLIGPDSSLKQIASAANILKQDMANRHQAYQQQINDIKGRLAGAETQMTQPGGGSAKKENIKPPRGKSVVYDPEGNAHFIFQNKVSDFLKDPQYKGWHE